MPEMRPTKETMNEYVMVNGITSSRAIKKAETGNFLVRDDIGLVIMKAEECSFSGVIFVVSQIIRMKNNWMLDVL